MNLLEFAFQSFWHFTGSIILLAIIVQWRPFASAGQGLSQKQFDSLMEKVKEKKNK